MWPLAFASRPAPCTDLSDTWPLPPRHLTSPFTVSAVTAPCAPSTSISVETPWRFRFIQAGAEIWYSTICANPRRLSAFTLTVEAPTWTSIWARLECVACTPRELQNETHGVGEVWIQIRAARIGRAGPPRLHDRGVDRHQALCEHAHRGAVAPPARAPLLQGALQLGDGRVVARARLLDPPHRGDRQIRGRPALRDRAARSERRAVRRPVPA